MNMLLAWIWLLAICCVWAIMLSLISRIVDFLLKRLPDPKAPKARVVRSKRSMKYDRD